MSRSSGQQRVFEAISEVVQRRAFDRALAATELFLAQIEGLGPVRREDEQLMAGAHALNRDRTILPLLAEGTGLGFCVYLGNRRVATATLLDAGTAPEVGGYAEPALIDAVLRRKDTLQSRIDYGGRPYIVVARPIFASGGKQLAPIGMIEAFQDEQAFFDSIAATTRATFQRERESMTQRADAMEEIIKFIDDLARRLQLLSLNGNIIAAQAGEHGRAFRVVCSELGGLADQSKGTAAEVRKLIAAMGLEEFSSQAELEDFDDVMPVDDFEDNADAAPAS